MMSSRSRVSSRRGSAYSADCRSNPGAEHWQASNTDSRNLLNLLTLPGSMRCKRRVPRASVGMLAAAVCAALSILCAPSAAAQTSVAPALAQASPSSIDQAVNAFYAQRRGAPLWLRNGAANSAASNVIGILQRASLDGLPNGPAFAAQAQALMARAQAGDPDALAAADRLLSAAWILYVQALQRPPAAMAFADSWSMPRRDTPYDILARAAAAPSLASYVRKVSTVNPLYARLRDAAWNEMLVNGGQIDPRVAVSLDHIRVAPFQHRYIIVDSGSARLWVIEDERIVDSMKVIVGKPSTQTPTLGSVIYYATLNPYWNVPPDLVRTLTAQRVLEQGLSYLKTRGYQVITKYGDGGEPINPAKVDWKAVAQGQAMVAVRQLPGPANSMGHLKFGFANPADVYLHDTPEKNLFGESNRNLSNGCIRLEDAQRLGRWLLGRDPTTDSTTPEQHMLLPQPVPIYLTYLTAHADDGQLSFVDDIYSRVSESPSEAVSMR
jgi:murein L,D-transpeptidase YcbB/YkuD